MNRYFSIEGGESDFPRRSFARLDQTEPTDLTEASKAVFAFEAVDADWSGFGSGRAFALDDPDSILAWQRRLWSDSFGTSSRPPRMLEDPFDDVPLYRLEITVSRVDSLFNQLVALGDDWVEIELDRYGSGVEVDVFAGLFFAPTVARLVGGPTPTPLAGALSAAFDMDSWPDASSDEIERSLKPACTIDQLAVFDVGQGSASALICPHGAPQLWYDLGCGVYRNASTRPSYQLKFCVCGSAAIVLSHWDSDHWAGARRDLRMLARTWIAPRQKIGSTHKTFGSDILKSGGRILIVGHGAGPFAARTSAGQELSLRRCTGVDRNGSGLALIVEDTASGRGFMLTGDASYNHIPRPWPTDIAALVVPHHGADMGAASVPPLRPSAPKYARLLYSFGPGNKHGRTSVSHPTHAAMVAHDRQKWNHGLWTIGGAGLSVPGADVLATAKHPATHLDGAMVGWTSAPAKSVKIACHSASGCSTPLTQS
ncbi:MAG: hypothetical protein ACREEB_01400 [Caulobacteraceae bacterium]